MTAAAVVVAPAQAALNEVLVGRARAWAARFCDERVLVCSEEDLAPTVADAFACFGGPLLIVRSDVPRLCRWHAEGALADMADGADASFGPALSGGWYLLALRAARPELLAAPSMAKALQVAAELQVDVGLLRTERTLGGPEDAAAVLADPLTPGDVRAALTR